MKKTSKYIKLIIIMIAICFCDSTFAFEFPYEFTSKDRVGKLGEIGKTEYFNLQYNGLTGWYNRRNNDGKALYCLDEGDNYCGGFIYTKKVEIKNSGLACGIIDALKNGELTVDEVNNVTDKIGYSTDVYGIIQKYIWGDNGKYDENSKCKNFVESREIQNLNQTGVLNAYVNSATLEYDSTIGKYVSKKITVETSNLPNGKYKISLSGAPTGTIVVDSLKSTTNLIGSMTSSSSLYIIAPDNTNGGKLRLTFNSTYNRRTITTTRTTYDVNIAYYETTADSNSCAGDKDKNQRLGIVKASSKKDYNTILSNASITKDLTFNLPSCVSDFNSKMNNGKVSMKDRIEIYQRYKKKNKDFRNLLDLSKTEATDACSAKTCKNHVKIGCLSAKNINTGFNKDDLSCYNDTIAVGRYTGYCEVTFNLENTLRPKGIKGFTRSYTFGTNFQPGQMVLNRAKENRLIAVGALNKICYVFGDNIGKNVTGEKKKSYSEYVNNLSFDDEILDKTISGQKNTGWVKSGTSKEAKFTKTLSTAYLLNPVYSNLGTGKISNEKCNKNNQCRLLGYGFASKLTHTPGRSYSVNFDIGKIDLPNTQVDTSKSGCFYKLASPGIVCDPLIQDCDASNNNLNIEFRSIETSNAFPGKGASGRIVGDNWVRKSFDFDRNGGVNNKDRNLLYYATQASTYLPKYDLNRDGIVNNKDLSFFDWAEKKNRSTLSEQKKLITLAVQNKDSSNELISYIMETTNNSYDKNKNGPIYKIRLNSDTIKEIREYNKTANYDDYTLKCSDNGTNCKSTFLEKFGIERLK